MVLKTFLTQHQSGLYVICAPVRRPRRTRSALTTSAIMRMLAAEFRYVVLDTAPGLSEITLAALDETSDLVMLTSMDVPGVRGLRKELDALAQIGQQFESRQIVLNLVDARGLLSVADVEDNHRHQRRPAASALEGGPDVGQPGVPLLQAGRRDAMTKQLRRLVDRVTAGDPAVRPAQGKGREARTSGQPVGPTRSEPTAGGDPPGRPWRHDTVRTLQASGASSAARPPGPPPRPHLTPPRLQSRPLAVGRTSTEPSGGDALTQAQGPRRHGDVRPAGRSAERPFAERGTAARPGPLRAESGGRGGEGSADRRAAAAARPGRPGRRAGPRPAAATAR